MTLKCNLSNANRQHPQPGPRAARPSDLGPEETVHALYLHLPFCFHKCHYCDFYSVVEPAGQDAPRQAAFTDALIAEVTRRAGQVPLRPATLFAGGGTPTYLRADYWDRLLHTLHGLGVVDRTPGRATGQEFTVEANPETVTTGLMQQLTEGGVNRVSIGAQSFDRGSLKALERWHDPDNVPRAVEACRSAGIDNLSLDLIFAIPGQTLAMLERDLDALLALRPNHLSTYGLTYEPNTPLSAKLRVGQVNPIGEELERHMYELVLNKLEANDYEHYEISNWAKRQTPVESDEVEAGAECSEAPDRITTAGNQSNRCRHNLAYWHNRNWLGVGPGAASHVAGRRWRNTPNLARYIDQAPDPPTQDHEALDAAGKFAEQLMLGLRLREGIDDAWFASHPSLRQDQRETADECTDRGLLERVEGRLRLTRRGLFVADSIIAKLL
ncbi:MAG: coproporphyrinogen-III oxidase family protein [Phycisphaeraceae bacterium]